MPYPLDPFERTYINDLRTALRNVASAVGRINGVDAMEDFYKIAKRIFELLDGITVKNNKLMTEELSEAIDVYKKIFEARK